MKAMVISGGTIEKDFALSFIRDYEPDYIVAADRGLAFCLENEIKVNLIVGDFDSIPGGILDTYVALHHVPVRRFNPVKDATDTEIAVRQVVEAGASEAMLLGATGTRLDHTIGNIQCLHILLDAGIPAAILDSHNRISLHRKDFFIKKDEQFGKYISFLPAGEAVEKLTLSGFKYPLHAQRITNADSLCISNEINEETAGVTFTGGELFMIQSRDC